MTSSVSPTSSVPELRFAVFGENGCGKTTLLTSYYGAQKIGAWETEHGYSLLAEDAARGKQLLDGFHGLEQGRFPNSTRIFTETAFQFILPGLIDPVLRVLWFDYPGEWWVQEPDHADEAARRTEAIGRLLTCQVGFLVFDGGRFQQESTPYAARVIGQFRDNVRRHRQLLERTGKTFEGYPRNWVFVLSKADLLPDQYSAADFEASLSAEAQDELDDLRREFEGSEGIGTRFLLLSSVKATADRRVVDPRSSLGLNLVAPLAFEAALRQIKGVPPAFVQALELAAKALEHLPEVLALVALLLPGPPKVKAMIWVQRLSAPLLRRRHSADLQGVSEQLRKHAQKLAKKGESLAAICLLLSTELLSEPSRRLVFLQEAKAPPGDADPPLREVTQAWSGLPETVKEQILDLARARV